MPSTLDITHPALIEEWDYEKNTDISPNTVFSGSTIKVWWKCKTCNHEWTATINNRAKKNRPSGCPNCAKITRIKSYTQTKLDGGKNSLANKNQSLASEWNINRNLGISPYDVHYNSKYKYWWICRKCGYEWQASPMQRNATKGCPICDGNKAVWQGHNDLASQMPSLLVDWDYAKNQSISPEKVRLYSGKKAWWKCHICGYEWMCAISQRTFNKTGCARCAGQIVTEGLDDLQTKDPVLSSEWDYEKNGDLLPTQFKSGSDKVVWWKCNTCGHSWKAAIKTRKIAGCPACSGRHRLGYNDISSRVPDIAKEWNYPRNNGLLPEMFAVGSHKKVWWKCSKCDYEWQAVIKTRTNGVGCPRCSGRIVRTGYNDFATKCPEYLNDWDYEKNTVKPEEITFRSSKKIWWKCNVCGHNYQMMPSAKSLGYGCPKCNRIYHSSFPEQAIIYYLLKSNVSVENGYKASWLGKSEIDIFLPDYNVGIEYDGQQWHQNPEKDIQKSQLIISHGIKLIRIREAECPQINDDSIKIFMTNDYTSDGSYLNDALITLFSLLKNNYGLTLSKSVDVSSDHIAISATYENEKKSKSLAYINPDLSAEWDYEKNEGLTPAQVTSNSHISVWWNCRSCGYKWRATVTSRSRGQGCPACSHSAVFPGKTDLATVNPELASEWNYNKNKDLNPHLLFPNSSKKAWWTCNKCGYEWQAVIAYRNNGSGCPACNNFVANKGINDLATLKPDLLEYWHYEKNPEITPDNITTRSQAVVNWKCKKCGYEWQESIYNRIKKNNKCPYCSGQIVWPGHNDFATLEPERMKDWDYCLNTDDPSLLSHYSHAVYNWVCHTCNHKWRSSLQTIVNSNGCPKCHRPSYKRIVAVSMAEKYPDKTMYWDMDKNSGLTPNDVSYGSNVKVWWKCPVCENEWQAPIKNAKTLYCSKCKKKPAISKAALSKKGSFKKNFPEIAKQWSITKNSLSPDQVPSGSAIKAWWECEVCGYEWEASIYSRTSTGSGCPYCAGKIVWPGHNDLATTNPELLKNWNYDKNDSISPQSISAGSHKKVWWKCSDCGFEWQAGVEKRNSGHGCPACKNRVLWPGHNDLETRFPNIASQWDYDLNTTAPSQVLPGSSEKFGWICPECSNRWTAAVNSRTAGHGCPKCARSLVGKKLRAKQLKRKP